MRSPTEKMDLSATPLAPESPGRADFANSDCSLCAELTITAYQFSEPGLAIRPDRDLLKHQDIHPILEHTGSVRITITTTSSRRLQQTKTTHVRLSFAVISGVESPLR